MTKRTSWGNNVAWGTQLRVAVNGTLAQSNGTLKRGTVLGKDSGTGKLSKLTLPTSKAAYDTGLESPDLDGAIKHILAAEKYILPGTVLVAVEAAADVDNNATDANADGTLVREDGTRVGAIDYETGNIMLAYPAAEALSTGSVMLSYKRLNAVEKSTPYGILLNDEVNTTSADQPVSVMVMGDVPRGGLIFPATATEEYLSYVRGVLADLGIHETGLAHGT